MNKREEILILANQAVNGERQQTYGSPERSFQRIALFWTAYLHRDHIPLTGLDVAKMMILFKLARTGEQAHLDNWVDIAGYAACAGEIEDESYNPKDRDKAFETALEEVKKAVGKKMSPEVQSYSEGLKKSDRLYAELKESDRLYAEAMRSAYNG